MIREVSDEREPLAEQALQLIATAFPPYDRHPLSALRSEIAEKRLGLLHPYDIHLFAYVHEDGHVVATVLGIYLAGVNAGFISYLAVDSEFRRRRLGREVRQALVEAFRADARRVGYDELAWVIGEVRMDSPWLHNLVRHGKAIPFDLVYYHPGMSPGRKDPPYVLYREPVGDHRPQLPVREVLQVLYAVWHRGYRVRYPLDTDAFAAMATELEGKQSVGPHPEVMAAAHADVG